MSGLDSSLGVKKETTFSTAVAVNRFYEQRSNSTKGVYERIESEAVRKGSRAVRSDRFAVNPKGAEGTVGLECISKGFGFWFEVAMGGVSTSALSDADSGAYVHTFVPASLVGKSFTMQVGKPDALDAITPFTYAGCKVKSWSLMAAVDEVLQFEVEVDAVSEVIGGSGVYALQAVDYSGIDTSELFTYAGGHVSIGGTEVRVGDVTFKGDNALKTDRWSQGAVKREQVQDAMAEYTFELGMEFEGVTQLNRVASANAAGALAEIVTYWTCPTLISGTTKYPTIKVTMSQARFDGELPEVDGAKMLEMTLSGKGLEGTNPPVKIEYTTSSATP